MHKTAMTMGVLVMMIATVAGTALAIPPEAINYQGVLRDAAGNPLDGSHDMVFRYYSADSGGTFYLMEEHLDPAGGGTGQVTVTGGLFNVALGTGDLVDVTGGAITTLGDVFTQSDVWLEVQVGSEILSPRIHVRGAPYAINSSRLDGKAADGFLDTSPFAQTKLGTLTVDASTAASYGIESSSPVGGGRFLDTDESGEARVGYQDFGVWGSGDNAGGYFTSSSATGQASIGYGNRGIDASGSYSGGAFSNTVTGVWTELALDDRGVSTNGTIHTADSIQADQNLSVAGHATVASLRTTDVASIYLNEDGPDGDATIYFYDAGAPDAAYLRWRNYSERFEINKGLRSPYAIWGSEFRDSNLSDYFLDPSNFHISGEFAGDLAIGQHAGDDNDTLYFDQQAAYLRWQDANARFEINAPLFVQGGLQSDSGLNLDHPDLYLNQDGPDSDSSIYFHEGTATGARLFWNDASDRFEFSHELRVPDLVVGTAFYDHDNTAFYVNPGSSEFSAVLAGGLIIGHGSGTDADRIQFDQQAEYLQWNDSKTRFEFSDELALSGPLQTGWTAGTSVAYNRIGATAAVWEDIRNADDLFVSDDLELGGELALSKVIRMEAQETTGADADQAIYFYDEGSPTSNFIQWDDVSSITCGTIGTIASGFRWSIKDNIDSGWVFSNGTDYEVVIDEFGNVEMDGSLHQSGSCDLAETFFGPEGLDAGTVVVLDPDRLEGVRQSTQTKDPTVAGVVTTRPGVLLSGPSADAYPVWEELEEVGRMLADLPPSTVKTSLDQDDEIVSMDEAATDLEYRRKALEQRSLELETELDNWQRGNVAVALVGRVPVKADASYGPIRKGDFLTTSATPGHAQVLDGPGPYLGIAMDDLDAGTGEVLVFLEKGWYGGTATGIEEPAEDTPPVIAEVQEMDAGLRIVLDRDRNDRATFSVTRDGGDGIASEVFRVDEQGNVFATGSFRPAAMDMAEFHPVSQPVEPGDVLVADRQSPGRMTLGRLASDPAVVGIVSTEPGVLLGSGLQQIVEADPELAAAFDIARATGDSEEEARLWSEAEARFRRGHAAIALSGTVPCKVDAGYGSIEVGDLLTVSPTAGHAMRAADPAPQGTVLGKALEPLDTGTGTIQVLVMMR